MKKNNLIILLSFVCFSCSQSKDYPTILGELEKVTANDKILQRQVATVAANKCLKDTFSVSLVKSEIIELEKIQATGTKVQGKWKHLNLETLPIPQANFLKTYGTVLGDLNNADAFDYSSCHDVPCIFNKIYGKDGNVAGYVHYLWYLKMGSYLSASNKIYDTKSPSESVPGLYNQKKFAVSAYLYRDSEIYAFWRLLQMMKTPHTALTDLKVVHRVPQGESFDFVFDERKKIQEENIRLKAQGKALLPVQWGETCGLAYSSGYVVLQDLCLGLSEDGESGSFYESVLHELTHQVDYHQGRTIGKTYRSKEQDYLTVSGFYMREYIGEDGTTVRQWGNKEGIQLVTEYAGGSPQENFAETIAHFRVSGTRTKPKISAKHWDYTSKNYFFDKSFEDASLVKDWLTAQSSSLSQLSFQAVGDCTQSTIGFASTYFQKTDFMVPLLPAMVNCLGAKASEISLDLQSKIKRSEPDGCNVLNENNTRIEWEPSLKLQLIALISKYLKEQQADKSYLSKVAAFYDEIPNRTMANSAFLACTEIETEEACYQEEVIRLVLEKNAPLKLPEAHALDLAELYLSSHLISDTEQYLNEFYKSFVVSHKAQIDIEATTSWDKCASTPVNDDIPPSGKHFTIGDGYMVSSIYNCLNSDFPDVAKSLVRNLAVGDFKVQHPKEEIIIYQEVVPLLQKSLSALYVKKQKKENEAVLKYILDTKGSLRKKMLADFAWVKNTNNTTTLNNECQKNALSEIDFPLRYQLKKSVFEVMAQNTCKDIHLTPEYKTWLEEAKSVFTDKSLSGLEKRIVELATIKAKDCIGQYPMDTSLNRIKYKMEREACLLGDWAQIEAAGIKEFESDPLVLKYKVDTNAIKSQLETNRRRSQLKVIKENF